MEITYFMNVMSISMTFLPLLMYNLAIDWRSNENYSLLLNMCTAAILDNSNNIKY
jgi:hypothetical protein